MYFKVRKTTYPSWKQIKTLNAYDAINILYDAHTIYFKTENNIDIYINPDNEEIFLVKRIYK